MVKAEGSAEADRGAVSLIATLCAAELLGMMGVFAFPALLPGFRDEWGLSHTQLGWVSGIYFAGYSAAMPVLGTLTDRVDARRIYLVSAVAGIGASLGFAVGARGFWTALLFRALGGLGLAGTFIPGLKLWWTDSGRLPGPEPYSPTRPPSASARVPLSWSPENLPGGSDGAGLSSLRRWVRS